MQKIRTTPFRILVAGYINVNVIDGSAFFISGLASMLSDLLAVDVDIVTANPVEKTDVLDEVMFRKNVQIVDPFSEDARDYFGEIKNGKSMSRYEYAELLARIGTDYDAIIVRDTECAAHLVRIKPEIGKHLFAYITGIRTVNQEIDKDLKQQIESIYRADANFLCQTSYIESALVDAIPNIDPRRIHILTPHVPGGTETFNEVFDEEQCFNKFVYTGKFFEDWNTDRILASFKDLNQRGHSLYLDVAGDQFRNSKENPNFVKNNRWLLDSTPGVTWHGRVRRGQSREIIQKSQIGIGWRSEALNESSELSTKILEYGILGRPSILNRTPLHEELLGSDYPLFANSMTEFKELLTRLPDDRDTVRIAAERCFNLAQKYTYSAVRPGFLDFLGNKRALEGERVCVRIDEISSISEELAKSHYLVCSRGQWLDIFPEEQTNITVDGQLQRIIQSQIDASEFEETLRLRTSRFRGAFQNPVEEKREVASAASEQHKEIESSLQRISRLEHENASLKSENADVLERLNALRNSRLGKLQVEIWRQRGGRPSSKLPSSSAKDDIVRRAISKIVRVSRK